MGEPKVKEQQETVLFLWEREERRRDYNFNNLLCQKLWMKIVFWCTSLFANTSTHPHVSFHWVFTIAPLSAFGINPWLVFKRKFKFREIKHIWQGMSSWQGKQASSYLSPTLFNSLPALLSMTEVLALWAVPLQKVEVAEYFSVLFVDGLLRRCP